MNTIYPSDLKLDKDLFYSCSYLERSLLITICDAVAEYRKAEFTIPFQFLNLALNDDRHPAGSYRKDLPSAFATLLKFSFLLRSTNSPVIRNGKSFKIYSFPLFSFLSLSDLGITVCLSPQFMDCTHHWGKEEWENWSDLDTFQSFESKYSLRLFLLLKKNKSPWHILFYTYRDAMGFPESYPTTSILERTQQAFEESAFLMKFKDISFIKKYGETRGHPLQSLTFFYTFQKSNPIHLHVPILEEKSAPIESK